MAPGSTTRRGPRARCAVGLRATGEAGHWTTVADILADAYTVITYDRRGNSRSPRPRGWTSTTAASRPTPPPCCADSTWYRRSCSAPAPPRASSPVCAFATSTCYAVRSSTNRHSRPAYPTSAPSTLRARRGWRNGLPRPARALRQSTAAGIGQAHLIRRGGLTRTRRRPSAGPGRDLRS
jgi:hypothetical protein